MEKNKACVISFLKAVLGIEIIDLTHENTELGKESAEEKLSRIDVLASIPGDAIVQFGGFFPLPKCTFSQ